ncbi:MAG: 2-oxoacid:acceptor oxidoreductase family protein [Candidatus Omnitrophota bacterium]
MKQINESIICAGFGGQGIMVLGKVLANAGMAKSLYVTWLPSYGAEVRGGTAHSMIRISSEPIASPVVSMADVVIAMNGPSMDKFKSKVTAGGLLILNTSMASGTVGRSDIDVVKAHLTDEAIKLGNVRVANMIAAGIFVAKKGIFDRGIMMNVIEEMAKGREQLVPINVKAVDRGIEIANSL